MSAAVAELFMAVCRAEVMALKPGNVHVHAAGHGMTVEDFLRSAEAAAPEIARSGTPVGERILRAVRATRSVVDCNTNLGILLLCAPLARAAELPAARPLRDRLSTVLAALTVEDAEAAFEAIRLASPGGLGRAAEHDVAGPATVDLRVVMTAARSRDRIAAQYADGYRDVFDIGVARVRSMADSDAVTMAEAVYLDFLTAFPDSHILRKHGEEVAASVLAEAREVRGRVAAASSAVLRREHLFVFDARLKWQGINPGTSADLTVASLFAHWLEGRQAGRKGTQA
ncbi:triphosphoribosyl-dephospho-CoA synthase [Azospirillum lipoferum]|uniref:Triphosphoribosyl-dephospho-CoA protein n=1 Tax=Azospirillum lipoferum TaxID=193 RepID=A0A5A9G3D4_AZOLI|nr:MULTISPECIES: triphosphoribosyl-dephospho-CoA synthase [Azospirillum]KAA0589123.1 triphosphoribosyl-dephospho-CoA protein [Azospirillum lipoferum]MCP1613431.1 triphosphoribosyl-dephospho-CoA synthase [Azospirillum lipoferum]MDW5533133.1 triphosphoribosyl-dephospho-CoA synthase [Azospirillum sp. NL1]